MTKKKNDTAVVAFKGFNPDWTCQGYQFAPGESYAHKGSVKICSRGFHACENPLDVLNYYPLISDNGELTKFAKVTVSGKIDRKDGDSKLAGASISIGMELNLPGFIKAGIDWLIASCKAKPGDHSQLAASGDSSQLAASGYRSQLAVSGDSSQLAASGYSSKLAASGHSSKLAASGYYSQLAASGNYSQLAASGDSSKLAASGYYSRLAASGDSSQLAASGDYSRLVASGYYSQLAASGDSSKLEITGQSSAAATVGINSRVKASAGSPVAICEYGTDGKPVGFATGIAGDDFPADTWVVAQGGKLVPAS